MTATNTPFPWTSREVDDRVRAAVKHYWSGRSGQATKQQDAGGEDSHIRFKAGVEIPGFYRPTKKWDVVESVSGRSTRRASPMAGLSLFSRRRTRIYEARSSLSQTSK